VKKRPVWKTARSRTVTGGLKSLAGWLSAKPFRSGPGYQVPWLWCAPQDNGQRQLRDEPARERSPAHCVGRCWFRDCQHHLLSRVGLGRPTVKGRVNSVTCCMPVRLIGRSRHTRFPPRSFSGRRERPQARPCQYGDGAKVSLVRDHSRFCVSVSKYPAAVTRPIFDLSVNALFFL